MEREGDDVPGDVGREARESLRGKFRSERLAMGLLVGREADGADLLQVRVMSQSVVYTLGPGLGT